MSRILTKSRSKVGLCIVCIMSTAARNLNLAMNTLSANFWSNSFLGLIALISEAVGTVSGFGSSTFFVPTALLFESFHVVLALTAILHVLSNSAKIVLFRGKLAWKEFIPFAVTSTICTAIGALLTSWVPVEFLKTSLGIVLMAIAVSHFFHEPMNSKPMNIVITGLSGFFGGLVGTGGAIRGIALRSMRLEKGAFVFASTFIDFTADLARAGIYVSEGYMDWNMWRYIPILILAAILGPMIGRLILSKIEQSTFEKIVSVFIFLSGLVLVY